MIRDTTIDEALIEILRTKRALEALRRARKDYREGSIGGGLFLMLHAAAKRASMDLTRKLADMRAGR